MRPTSDLNPLAGQPRTGAVLGARTFLAIVTLLIFVAVVGVSALFFLAGVPIPRELLLWQVVLMIGLWALTRPPPRRTNYRSCTACSAALYPTRGIEGQRLWTCFRCGFERHRGRSVKEIGPMYASLQ